jgi:hypothetical protein
MGKAFGDKDSMEDNLGWTFLSPLFFEGSPALTTTQTVMDLGRKASQGRSSLNMAAGVASDIAQMRFTGGGAVADVYGAATKERTATGKAGRFLGFKRGKQ